MHPLPQTDILASRKLPWSGANNGKGNSWHPRPPTLSKPHPTAFQIPPCGAGFQACTESQPPHHPPQSRAHRAASRPHRAASEGRDKAAARVSNHIRIWIFDTILRQNPHRPHAPINFPSQNYTFPPFRIPNSAFRIQLASAPHLRYLHPSTQTHGPLMKIALDWIAEYLTPTPAAPIAADALMNAGLPVESIADATGGGGKPTQVLDVEVTSNRSDLLLPRRPRPRTRRPPASSHLSPPTISAAESATPADSRRSFPSRSTPQDAPTTPPASSATSKSVPPPTGS